MLGYMTEQRKTLFAFFEEKTDKQFSARDIFNALKNDDVSLSAVYRNLSSLEKDGLIRRTIKEGSRECVFQYIHPKACMSHIHMECQKCGDTFHMEDSLTALLKETVFTSSGFTINNPKTVLYGNCKECESLPIKSNHTHC